jgi:two-component system phosphate regulon sensor histidine kinase PhoR
MGELKKVELVPILENCIIEISSMFPEKTLQPEFDMKIQKSSAVIWANNLLADIFLNILTNAVKFTEGSLVKINIQVSDFVDDREHIQITFDDFGNGIPPEIIEVLFDRSERLKKGWKAKKGSTGLGVTIIKSLVEIFGGEVFYLNRVNEDWTKGTSVILRFPQVIKTT